MRVRVRVCVSLHVISVKAQKGGRKGGDEATDKEIVFIKHSGVLLSHWRRDAQLDTSWFSLLPVIRCFNQIHLHTHTQTHTHTHTYTSACT